MRRSFKERLLHLLCVRSCGTSTDERVGGRVMSVEASQQQQQRFASVIGDDEEGQEQHNEQPITHSTAVQKQSKG